MGRRRHTIDLIAYRPVTSRARSGARDCSKRPVGIDVGPRLASLCPIALSSGYQPSSCPHTQVTSYNSNGLAVRTKWYLHAVSDEELASSARFTSSRHVGRTGPPVDASLWQCAGGHRAKPPPNLHAEGRQAHCRGSHLITTYTIGCQDDIATPTKQTPEARYCATTK